jgi:hypothetical protein
MVSTVIVPYHCLLEGSVSLTGQLHLCPLQAIVQLRPSLQHLDQAAAGRRCSATTEASSDGDTTESEGEEARPVTVKFARRETGVSRYAPSFYLTSCRYSLPYL